MLADPSVGARLGIGRVGVVDLASLRSPSFVVFLEPPSPIGPFVGVDVSIVHYPILGSSRPKGLSFVACPDRSGSKTSSVSSLTGVIEWNPGLPFVTGSA